MTSKMHFGLEILPQPDQFTCGPTCLQAVYRYYGDSVPLPKVIDEIPQLEDGGTLAVVMACHALARGYQATIYTYNVNVFDPTWFADGSALLTERLAVQEKAADSKRVKMACREYLDFIRLGGKLRMEDLTSELIRRFLKNSTPILTGLSATYLYRAKREFGRDSIPDDVRGAPVGHFVVLCGYDQSNRTVLVADPLHPNPFASQQTYAVEIDRLKNAILLGIVTHDANLLIIEPRTNRKRALSADSHHRE
ncbi:MAG TPA: hypothetical protein VHX68_04435 [Planctomycetaceae bacterium]|jgi:hypothetical protein|nr:hypothetical protein [Planctomycetaceae bacterium]